MVHIEIILYTVYCIVFSTACFLVLKKLYNKKLEELEKKYKEDSENMECKFKNFGYAP